MSKINLSIHDGADYLAKQFLDNCTSFSSVEKKHKLAIVNYNVGVAAFNLGTVILVKAVVLALFTKFAAAVALGAIGYGLRQVGERIHNQTAIGLGATFLTGAETIAKTFGLTLDGWNPNLVSIDDIVILKDWLPLRA